MVRIHPDTQRKKDTFMEKLFVEDIATILYGFRSISDESYTKEAAISEAKKILAALKERGYSIGS